MLPKVISVDDHVMEPPDLFERRLPAKFRQNGPRVVRRPWEVGPGYRQNVRPASSGPETDFWLVEDIYQSIGQVLAAAGRRPEDIKSEPIEYAQMRPGCYEVKARLADMDVIQIERSLCFPNVCRFGGQLFLWLKDRELALACVRAYNDWMVDEWAGESGGRLIPLCIIPLWDAHAAAAEVRRNAARGVHAVTFTELPAALELPTIHDRDKYWIPFIEACNETRTTICIHIGSGSTVATSSKDVPMGGAIASTAFNSQLAFTDWLVSGLLARYPDLKIAFSESQIGWMPYVMERIDRIWRQGNAVAHMDSALVEPPTSYMAGRVFGCFFEDDFGVEVRNSIGIDQITFEADYPHQDSCWPYTHDYFVRAMSGLNDDEIYKIARGNAIRMLELDPDPDPSVA